MIADSCLLESQAALILGSLDYRGPLFFWNEMVIWLEVWIETDLFKKKEKKKPQQNQPPPSALHLISQYPLAFVNFISDPIHIHHTALDVPPKNFFLR